MWWLLVGALAAGDAASSDACSDGCRSDGGSGLNLLQLKSAAAHAVAKEGQWTQEIREAFDHCTQVYLDLGSNLGVHVRFLFEASHYPNSSAAAGFLSERFGAPASRGRPSRESGLCALGVEANPNRASHLRSLEDCYAQQGWTVKFLVPVALAARSNEAVEFFVHGNEFADLGASFAGDSAAPGAPNTTRVSVPTLDLSELVRAVRELPRVQGVAAKMDIEGAEFEVLPRLNETGELCGGISAMAVEWHDARNGPMSRELKAAIQERYGSETVGRLRDSYSSYRPAGCEHPTQFVEADDESYQLDQEYPIEQLCPTK